MALIIVLWLIVLLGVMAAGHARNVHTETLLASRQLESARARALAEAGVQHAIIELLARNSVREWPINGTITTVNIDGHEVSIAVRDATGLIDLNAASADLLAAAFAATGGEEGWRQDIVDAILDWRDGDSLRHLNGVEDDDYRAAGLAWTARDGAFTSIDELRYVLGMRQEIFDKLAPFLTVHSGRPGLNLEYAPPFLIKALTGEYVEPAESALPDDAVQSGTIRQVGGARNGTYHVYVHAAGAAGVVASLEAVVRIAATSDSPYTILSWREPMRPQFPTGG
jgi:general secretion pathway protein K